MDTPKSMEYGPAKLPGLSHKFWLFLLFGVPIAALMTFSSALVLEKRGELAEMEKLDRLSGFIRQLTGLVHEMQKERGLTSGFIASRGASFGAELIKQRAATDGQYSRFMASYSSIMRDVAHDVKVEDLISLSVAELAKLKGARAGVDSLENGYFDAFEYYSKTNSLMLETIVVISQLVADRKISFLYYAYYHLLMMKEKAGMQRAALTYVFGTGKFPPGQYRIFMGIAADEANSRKRFLSFAPPDVKESYLKVAAMPEVARADAMREVAVEMGMAGDFGIDAARWNAMQTVKIDRINDVCGLLDKRVGEAVAERRVGAETALWSYLLASIAVIVFSSSMVGLLVRNMAKRREAEENLAEYSKSLEETLGMLERSAAISGAVSKIAPVGHIVADSAGTIISSNPAAERMFGYSAGEMSGKNVNVLAPTSKEDEYSKYIRNYTDFKKTGLPDKRTMIRVPKELMAVRKNGEYFYISLYVKEVLLSGDFLFIGIMEDITERREAVLALAEAHGNGEAIMNASNETLALIGLEGNVLSINDAGAKRLNSDRAGLVGKSLFDILPFELAVSRMELMEAAARAGKTSEFEDRRGDKWFHNIVHPVFNKDGKVAKLALFATDITERKRWESNLNERDKKIQSILAAAPDAIIMIDTNGTIEMFNPAGEKMFGWAAYEAIGRNVKMLMPEPYASEHDRHIGDYIGGGEKKALGAWREVPCLRKDGSIFPGELHVSEIVMGDATRFLGIVHDISGRKAAEEAVRQSRQNLATAQQIAHLGSFDFNPGDYSVLASEEVFRIFGLAPVEGPVSFNALAGYLHPEDRGRLAEYLENAMESGIFPDVEYRIITRDGMERIIRSQAMVLLGEEKQPVRVVGTMLDVTELRTAESHLRESLLRYSGIIDNVDSVIYTLDVDGHAEFISKEAVNIIGPGVVSETGFSLWDGFVVEEDRGKYEAFRMEIASEGGTKTLQYRIRKEDGSIAWLSDRCSQILDEDGKVAYYQGIVDDITKLKRLERLKDDFFHAVVHDLKSPITGIKVELEMLGDQIEALSGGCPAREACLKILSGRETSMKQKVVDIGEGVSQLYLMIQSLLKLGEMEEEKLELHYEPFAMNDLLYGLDREFRGRALAKGVTMEIRNSFMGTVIADQNLLKRVLQNLVDNAVKYSLPNTTITIEASCAAKGGPCKNIIISVTNAGQPLTEDKVNALFQKFKTLGHVESGSGIGLFFCHKTMELLGGGIYVDQDADAITFHIFFPNG